MILPILAYGHPILRKKCKSIEENSKEIKSLISNMWETMYNAEGVGLAAPQVGVNKKIFIIDANPLFPCLLYTSPSPRDGRISRMPSSA